MMANQWTVKARWLLLGISIVLTILSFSCKVRQVSKTDVHSTDNTVVTSHKDSSGTKTTTSVDTSQFKAAIKRIFRDSTVSITNFIPMAGTKTTINPDGSITGQFSNIQTTTHKHINQTTDKQLEHKNAIATSTVQASHTLAGDSSRKISTKDSTSKQIHSDSTVAANFPIKWVLIALAGTLILAGLFWKFRKFFGIVGV